MRKNDIIEGSVECWKHSTDNTDNLIMAGSGNENYTTNNTSCYPLPSESEGFIVLDLTEKTCRRCNQTFPISYFRKHSQMKDGHLNFCKACKKIQDQEYHSANYDKIQAQRKQYREANPDTVLASARTYKEKNRKILSEKSKEYAMQNREEVLKRKRAHYFKNRERILETQKVYSQLHAESIREKANAWRINNPEKRRVNHSKRKASKLGNGGSHTPGEWEYLKQIYDFKCLKCGRKEPEIKLTRDHIIPLSKGGTDNIGNLQPLCFSCNSSKHAKFIDFRGKKKK